MSGHRVLIKRTPISRSPLDKNPMPRHLSELQPVNAVNTKGQFFRAPDQERLESSPLWGLADVVGAQ